MIRFYFGAGSDETATALTKDIRTKLESGAEVLLLVPEQETVAVERRMLAELPAKFQLSFEVVNFSRLANRIHRALGGHRFHTATAPVRSLVMWNALRQKADELLRYKGHAHETRLCDMMLEAATRYHAHCISACDLREKADELPEAEPLRAKLLDVSLLMDAYEQTLLTAFGGDNDELSRAATRLAQNETLLKNTHIFVDSFHDFTGEEHVMLATLVRHAASVTFTTPLLSVDDDGLHLRAARHTFDKLRELPTDKELVHVELCSPKTALEHVARNLFRMEARHATFQGDADAVTLTVCDNPFCEADAAVSKIHELVRGGCHYRDITVVTRDANAWTGILDAALERDGIPFYLAEKTDVTVRPLIKLLLLALRIHIFSWRDQDVIAYAKTGLCDVSPDDVNCFEEYVNLWHPRGAHAFEAPFTRNPDGFTLARSARGEHILEGANRTRERVFAPLFALGKSLDGAQNAGEMCRALYAYMQALDVGGKCAERAKAMLAAGNVREAEELSRLYDVTVDALEAVARTLGEEKISVSELLDALKLVFARTDIGTIPTAIDEVTVGSASMLRADRPKYVIVLGLNEGVFPAAIKDSAIITEAERARLADLGLALPGAREDQSSNELFFLQRAFHAPRSGLYLYYSAASTDGGALQPSIAVARVQKLLGLTPRAFGSRAPEEEPFFDGLSRAATLALHAPLNAIYSVGAALDRLPDFEPHEREAIAALLQEQGVSAAAMLSTPVSDPNAVVPPAMATDIFTHSHVSASSLESYTDCRFAYYCNKVLSLREKKSTVPSSADSGTFIHHILEHFIARTKEQADGFAAWTGEQTNALVHEIAASYRDALIRENSELTPRSDALLSRLTTVAGLVVRSLTKEFVKSDFSPAVSELDLAKLGAKPYVTLQNGDRVALAGKVDRLDVWNAPDGNAYVRVVDYKTGAKQFSPEDVAKGNSLQMPLYLMTLCEKPHAALNEQLGLPLSTQLRPAGVTYFSSKLTAENSPAAKDAATVWQEAENAFVRSGVVLDRADVLHAVSHEEAERNGKTEGLLDARGFDTMFDDLKTAICAITEDMKGGSAIAAPSMRDGRSKCNTCPYAAVCRAARKTKEGEF